MKLALRSPSSVIAAGAALLLALAAPPARAAQEEHRPAERSNPTYTASYPIHFLDVHAAEQLAWDQCPAKNCRVSWVMGTGLELTADAVTHERLARALTREDSAPRTQSFQLMLLAADTRGDGAAPELPKTAQKALQDLRDFLPFKSYRLLDMAWLRTTESAEARLVGLNDKPYRADLHFHRVGDPAAKEILVDRFLIREAPESPPRPAASKEAPGSQPQTPHPLQDLISTSFGMHVGETLVVGTSKIDGAERALVVLLTAVP